MISERALKVESMEKKEPLHVSLGTLGFFAEADASGNEYSKWVSQSGELVIGSLPDAEDMPDLSEVKEHTKGGVKWKPITLSDFARLG